jgi:uncharacterized protein
LEKQAVLRVRLTPRGGKNALIGFDERDVLLARVAAPPVDGAANKALIQLISDVLNIPKSRINFHSGETAREKALNVCGLDPDELNKRLKDALSSAPAISAGKSKSNRK